MDEPFSALDVLTAENLRGELLELWLNKKMPTSAIFIVTHNIEEAVMLADRILVLGRNPARIRSDFNVRLKHPRDRKSARFVELVDYIYKVMTEPDVEHTPPDAETTAEIVIPPPASRNRTPPSAPRNIRCFRMPASAASPASSSFSAIVAAAKTCSASPKNW